MKMRFCKFGLCISRFITRVNFNFYNDEQRSNVVVSDKFLPFTNTALEFWFYLSEKLTNASYATSSL